MMGAHTLTIKVDPHTATALAQAAEVRHVSVEEVAAEALAEALSPLPAWSAEDLAAIKEGFEQLDRGEGVSQDVVEREIDELLRS
jgi:predicted transcriptional regulator